MLLYEIYCNSLFEKCDRSRELSELLVVSFSLRIPSTSIHTSGCSSTLTAQPCGMCLDDVFYKFTLQTSVRLIYQLFPEVYFCVMIKPREWYFFLTLANDQIPFSTGRCRPTHIHLGPRLPGKNAHMP